MADDDEAKAEKVPSPATAVKQEQEATNSGGETAPSAAKETAATGAVASASNDVKAEDDGVDEELSQKSFPERLLEILGDEGNSNVISWNPSGTGFIISKKKKFASEVLPRYFKVSKFTSFTRKLNRWGFSRVARGPETGSYFHKFFQRDNPELCRQMTSSSGNKYHANPMQAQLLPTMPGMMNPNAMATIGANPAAVMPGTNMLTYSMPTLAMGNNNAAMPGLMGNVTNMTPQQQMLWQQQQMQMMQMQQLQMMQMMQQQQPQSMPQLGQQQPMPQMMMQQPLIQQQALQQPQQALQQLQQQQQVLPQQQNQQQQPQQQQNQQSPILQQPSIPNLAAVPQMGTTLPSQLTMVQQQQQPLAPTGAPTTTDGSSVQGAAAPTATPANAAPAAAPSE